MEQSDLQLSCVVLCGGESRRMGRDKALLQLHGMPLAALLAERLEALGPVALSVRDEAAYPDLPWPKLADETQGLGPLSGLCAALDWAGTELVFVCACDLPQVQAETARTLASALTPEADAVIPIGADGRLHPLCGVYRKRCLAAARARLDAGQLRLRELLGQLNVIELPAECLPGGEGSLLNLNTPEELGLLTDRFFTFDPDTCIGCGACQVAGQDHHGLGPGECFRRVKEAELGGRTRFISSACHHCEDPACLAICPKGVFSLATDGTVRQAPERCIGCGRCIRACPFDALVRSGGVVKKCDGCYERRLAGQIPVCAAACPTGSLRWKEPDQAAHERAERLGASRI